MRKRSALHGIGGDAMVVGLGQLAAFAYPIISLPLLTRLLGVNSFGRLVIIVAILQLIVRLCDYGFSVSAVRRIVIAKDDSERSQVILSTLLAVVLLWLAGASALLVIISAVPALHRDFELYLIGTLIIAGGIGFPSWLLQGLRRLRLFAVITATSRCIALMGLIITVTDRSDIGWAVAWQFAPPAIASLLVWPLLAHRSVRWSTPSLRAARSALADGRELFFASLAHSLMGSAPVVVLGLVSVPSQAGHYGAGERFGNAGRGVLFAIVDALMPRMVDARDPNRSGTAGPGIIMIAIFGLFASGGAALIVAAPWLVPWYLGAGFIDVVPIAQIIGVALVTSGGVAVLMLDLNSQHRYSATAMAMMSGAVAHLVILVPMAGAFGAIGAAWALVLGELFITGLLFVLRWRAAVARTPLAGPTVSTVIDKEPADHEI